jgi:fatty acid desaturase
MTPATEVTSDPNPAETAVQAQQARRKKRRMFALGLAVRLFGALLIWLGDGSPSLFRKAVVVLGVILSVGGIAVLRFMLISGFRKKK